MADEYTRDSILRIVVDNKDGLAALVAYGEEIEKVKNNVKSYKDEQKNLDKAYKEGKVDAQTYKDETARLREEITRETQTQKALQKQMNQVEWQMQKNIQQNAEAEGSLKALRGELSQLNSQFDSLSREDRLGDVGENLKEQIQQVTDELMKAEAETGRFQRNVGNYKSAFDGFKDVIGPLSDGLEGAAANMNLFGINSEKASKIAAALKGILKIIAGAAGMKGFADSTKAATNAEAGATAATTAMGGAMTGTAAATSAASVAMQAFKTALISTGIGAIVVLLGQLLASLKDVISILKKSGDSAEEVAERYAAAIEKQKVALEQIKTLYEARGATSEEVLLMEIKNMQTLLSKTREYYNSLVQMKAGSEDLAKALDAIKTAQENLNGATLNGQVAVERFVSAAAKIKDQSGMTEYAKQVEAVKDQFSNLRLVVDALLKSNAITVSQWNDLYARLKVAQDEYLKQLEDAEKKAKAQQYKSQKENAQRIADEAANAMKTEEERLTAKYENDLATLNKYHIDSTELTKKYYADLQAIRDKRAADDAKALQDEIKIRIDIETKIIEARLRLAEKGSFDEMEIQKELEEQKFSLQMAELEKQKGTEELQQLMREEHARKMLEIEQAYWDAKDAIMAEEIDRTLAQLEDAAKKEQDIDNGSVEGKRAAASAIADALGSVGDLAKELSDDDAEMAKAAKVLALAKIAVNTGVAMAEGIASASATPFPANIAAIASTIAAVVGGMTSAIASVKSAKFARGGLVTGPGSGTSDDVPAMLSNGESVITARATSMFAPLLSSINQMAGGNAITPPSGSDTTTLEDAIARGMQAAQLKVSVTEIDTVKSRIEGIKSNADV